MSRHKGRPNLSVIERDFPHIVEMAVPLGGFGKQLDAMYDWHRAHDIEVHRGTGRREEERDIARWCFADQKTAADFAAAFGGIVLVLKNEQ